MECLQVCGLYPSDLRFIFHILFKTGWLIRLVIRLLGLIDFGMIFWFNELRVSRFDPLFN